MKIYTKKGDKGVTSTINGERKKKSDPQIQVNGAIDELNSYIGLLVAEIKDTVLKTKLVRIQEELMKLGVDITYGEKLPTGKSFMVDNNYIERLEIEIDQFESQLPVLKNFILPGGSRAGAVAHICRNICRRAERDLVAFGEERFLNEYSFAYLNRLSDWLFVFARTVNKHNSIDEQKVLFD